MDKYMEERQRIDLLLPNTLYRWLMNKVRTDDHDGLYPDANRAVVALLTKQKRREEATPLCPHCGSPGELLGFVDVPDRTIAYSQYRCIRCGNGFMQKCRCLADFSRERAGGASGAPEEPGARPR